MIKRCCECWLARILTKRRVGGSVDVPSCNGVMTVGHNMLVAISTEMLLLSNPRTHCLLISICMVSNMVNPSLLYNSDMCFRSSTGITYW